VIFWDAHLARIPLAPKSLGERWRPVFTPKMKPTKLFLIQALIAAVLLNSAANAQTVATPPSTEAPKDEVVVLNPFQVTTEKDRGYRATNSISGTRLNSAIKDLPMPIEVITEEFLRDTGSTDLRQSLRYSSGILLQTQNDYGSAAGSFSSTPGKINNPEGQTANPDQTHMKIRGFETASVLRDGFRRQNSTDSVNISRVEIARGPSSLLYGVGNFGGVVNYLTKLPEYENASEVTLSVGSYNFMRGTIDVTGPLGSGDKLAYRLTGAVQDQESYTDFNDEKHFFVSPVIVWRPFKGTEILLDLEYGQQQQAGIGWQRLRAAVSGFVNDSAGYNGDFLNLPGKNMKTFRWSGPDTYRDSTAGNVEFKITQSVGENLHFLAGVNHSTFKYDQLDNLAALQTVASGSSVPSWAIAPVTYAGLRSNQSGVPAGPQPSTIIYQWEKHHQDNTHDQVRVEANYDLKLFQDSSKWLRLDNSFLFGFSYTRDETEDHTRQTPGDAANYHSPADLNAFRYGKQGDGSPDIDLVEWDNQISKTSNPALYAVYQGKWLDERLTVIAGVRRDRSWNKEWIYNPEFRRDGSRGGDAVPRNTYSTPSKDTTYQFGASFAVTRELSVYAMSSEGVEPNYQGKLDFNGTPLQAALAKNKEYGLKIDLFNGKLSGTISKFEITRTRSQVGSSSLFWFVPVASANPKFNPGKDIVYAVNEQNPHADSPNKTAVDSTAQWDAAVAAGAIYQATNSTGSTNWYVNASKPTGATFLDAIFSNAIKNNYDWWGWLYNGSDPGSLPFDNLVNNATMDDNGAQNSVATGSDRSSGWDTQLIFTPTPNLQFLVSWSHITKVVLNAQTWAKYPYPQDRWAIWYAPYTFAATAGRPLNEVYGDPADTSTFIAFGTGLALDDTPKDQGTFWMNYKFPTTTPLSGFSVGVGGYYESERSIYPAFGQNALDVNGKTIFLSTGSRTSVNAMIKYEFKLHGRDTSVQLNVENVADDQKLYGFIYAAPRRWQLTFNHKL
jgi:iron complex outermembrane recepter protein